MPEEQRKKRIGKKLKNNMVEANDPDNIEAIFYSAYGKAKSSLTSDDVYKRQAIFNSLQKCISIIDDHYDPSKEAELRPIIQQISNDVLGLCCSDFVYTRTTDGYGGSTDNSQMTYSMFATLAVEFTTTIDNIISKFPDNQKKDLGYLFQIMIDHYTYISNCGVKNYDAKRMAARQIGKVHEKWNQYDPSHIVPDAQEAVNRVNAAEHQEKKSNTGKVLFVIGIFAFIIIGVFTGGIS